MFDYKKAPDVFDYTRVSDVIAPFTGIDLVDPDVLQKAANKGSRVHEYIEYFLKNNKHEEEISDESCPYIHSFDLFWEGNSHLYKNCQLELEKRFFDDNLKLTGKVDAIYTKPGRTYLLDWKTSSKFHNHWYLQGAAYKHLVKLNGYDNPDDPLFVHLKKWSKSTSYKDPNPEKSWDIFLKCLELYRYFKMEQR